MFKKYVCFILLGCVLSACGGGGGTIAPSTVSTTPFPTVTEGRPTYYTTLSGGSGDVQDRSSETTRTYNRAVHTTAGLDSSDTETNKYSGKGVRIGIIETGVYVNDDREFLDASGNSRFGDRDAHGNILSGMSIDRRAFNGYSTDDAITKKAPFAAYCHNNIGMASSRALEKDGSCFTGAIYKGDKVDKKLTSDEDCDVKYLYKNGVKVRDLNADESCVSGKFRRGGKKLMHYTKLDTAGHRANGLVSIMAGKTYGIANQARIFVYQGTGLSDVRAYFFKRNADGSYARDADGNLQAERDFYKTHYNARASVFDSYVDAMTNKVLAVQNNWAITNSHFYDDSTAKTYSDCLINAALKTSSVTREECNKISLWGLTETDSKNTWKKMIATLEEHADKLQANPYDATAKDLPIIVSPTGNDAQRQPSRATTLGHLKPKTAPFMIAVSGIESTGYEYARNNSCGVAKYYCVAGLASLVDTRTREKGKYAMHETQMSGTEVAAASVTAGMAMIKEKFPSLSAQEIRFRLLHTARHTLKNGRDLLRIRSGSVGSYTRVRVIKSDTCISPKGCSEEFGNGAMRLDLALRPVGDVRLATAGTRLDTAKMTSIRTVRLTSSGAFGSGFATGFATQNISVYDSLGAGFKKPLNTFVSGGHHATYNALQMAQKNRNIARSGIRNTAGLSYTHSGHDETKQMGFVATSNQSIHSILGNALNYRSNIGRLNLVSGLSADGKTLLYGMERMVYFGNNTIITPLANLVYEQDKVLGAKGQSAFRTTGNSVTTFVGIKAHSNLGQVAVYGYANMGSTKTGGDFGSGLQSIHNIRSQDFGLGFSRNIETLNGKAKYGLAHSMPLRVSSADATVHYSTGRDKNKNLSYATHTVNVAPKGKARLTEMFYQHDTTVYNSVIKGTSLRLSAVYHQDVNHTEGLNTSSVGAYYKIKF